MSDTALSNAAGSLVPNRALGDAYEQAKAWFTRLDPGRKKLAAYHAGIKRKLGLVQIMGMASPRPLENLYVALRAVPDLRKHRSAAAGTLGEQNSIELAAEMSRSQSRRLKRDLVEIIDDLGYADLFDDDDETLELHPVDQGITLWEGDAPSASTYARWLEAVEASEDVAASTAHRGVDALALVEQLGHVAILGGPGSGKTTLLKYLALAYTGHLPAPSAIETRLPLYVPLRELSRVEPPSPSAAWLNKFAVACASDITKHAFSAQWLSGQLEDGKCLVLLDGIDELPANAINPVMQSIGSFTAKYPNNKIVVTCRTAAYSRTLQGFQICEVADFEPDDIDEFASYWFDGRREERQRFLADLKHSMPSVDLCRSPLLLTLLCIAYDLRRSLPRNRAELYENCVDALMWRWDTSRSIERPVLSEEFSPPRKCRLLSQVARCTFERSQLLIPKPHLVSLLAAGIEKLGVGRVRAEELLTEFEANHGLLVERAPGIFCFSHLSFHEFFAALAYAGDASSSSELLARAVSDARYREVFLMVLEKLYAADDMIVGLVSHVKHQYIRPKMYDAYIARLIRDVRRVKMCLDPKLRRVLQEVEVEMQMLDIE